MERYENARLEISEFAEDVITASDTHKVIDCEMITHDPDEGNPPTWWVYFKDHHAERYDQTEEPEIWSQCP